MQVKRDYAAIAQTLGDVRGDRADIMRTTVDALWNALAPTGVSWIGFYYKPQGPEGMILGPCRDKPACSPLGLHGACGQTWRDQRSLVVNDARSLGDDYVACDPRDQSEVVVPLFEADGSCWGVLDADSHETGMFSEHDAQELATLMVRLGLSARLPEVPTRVV